MFPVVPCTLPSALNQLHRVPSRLSRTAEDVCVVKTHFVHLCLWLAQSLAQSLASVWRSLRLDALNVVPILHRLVTLCQLPLQQGLRTSNLQSSTGGREESSVVLISHVSSAPPSARALGLGRSALAALHALVLWHVEVEKTGHCQGLVWHRAGNIG